MPHDAGRRRVLRVALAGTTTLCAGALAPPLLAAAGSNEARALVARATGGRGVAVIGAGIAGLACATELARKRIPATVFEASARVGGRCWSLRDTFPGQVAERGAEFIGSSHHAMLGYARALGLRLETVDGTSGGFHHYAGMRYSEAEIAAEFREFAVIIRDDVEAIGAPHADHFTPQAEVFDFMTLDEYLVLYGASGLLRSVLRTAFLAEFGSELDEVSALAFLRFIYGDRRSTFGYAAPGDALRVVGGNDLITTGLARQLPQPVVHGHRLVAINRRFTGGVRLTFDIGGQRVQSDHEAVVLALPFSVLRDVQFGAAIDMPAWKHMAIRGAEMGDASRLLVGFTRPYWRESGASGGGNADLPYIQNVWETNPSGAGRQGAVLAQQVGGAAARALVPASVQSDAAGFLAALEEVLPGARDAVARNRGRVVAASENWQINRNSRGAMPRPQPGYFTRIAHREAPPLGNILFAGDQTSSFYEWQGFMEGAALSGLRAAAEACDLVSAH
ncbi:flavin monoamine oxidase family protein [Luteimonas deserti]|uniref:FAD-dependent oxidoreductase n=1 Tax=Luteimonas deserti TaxID=2752306 RepID=A0A7Z0TX14_9GAMM|nr:NAD(P)/FAD-dependent oxidoreductase [Luteimonas deserti]NYZ61325.1 FAD-dependent oxidoreductase [Luteimonas deserti]